MATTQTIPNVHSEAASKPERKPFFERCQPVIPILSAFVPILGFFCGLLTSTLQMRTTVEERRQAEEDLRLSHWRAALQSASFDEANLIHTAFLMEDFADDKNHGTQARRVELAALEQTARADTFDIMFWNLLSTSRTADDVNDLIKVGLSLDDRLHSLWQESLKSHHLAAGQDARFGAFLKRPQLFYSAETNEADLKSTLTSIWQLDTLSAGLACTWDPNDNRCPKFPAGAGLNLEHLTMVNYDGPTAAADGRDIVSYPTCAIEHGLAQQGGLMCSARDDTTNLPGPSPRLR